MAPKLHGEALPHSCRPLTGAALNRRVHSGPAHFIFSTPPARTSEPGVTQALPATAGAAGLTGRGQGMRFVIPRAAEAYRRD